MPSSKKKKRKIQLKDIFYLILLGLFIYVIYQRRDEVLEVLRAAVTVKWQFLIYALLIWLIWQLNLSFYYVSCYRVLKMRVKWYQFFWLTLAANFLGMVAPSGGFVAAVGYIIQDGYRRGLPRAKLMMANIVYWMVFYSVFVFLLIVSLFYLLIRNTITDFIVVPALIMFAIVMALFIFFILFLNDFDKFKSSALMVVGKINQLRARLGMDVMWDAKTVKKYAFELFEGYHFVLSNVVKLRRVLMHAFFHIVINVGILSVLVMAVDGDWQSWGVLLATYVVAALLMVVSVTPSGVGVVEVAMVMILSSFLLTVEKSLVVVLLFRLYQFWLPLVLGFVTFRLRGGGDKN